MLDRPLPGRREQTREIKEVCARLLGQTTDRIEFPGGQSRKSVRAQLRDYSVIVTKRRTRHRGEMEAEVLRGLYKNGARVPRVLAFDGTWLIQQDLGRERLSQTLKRGGESGNEEWLDAALDSLCHIHQVARESGLDRGMTAIGGDSEWLARLADAPARLGRYLGLPAPPLSTDRLVGLLKAGSPQFIKWDARPGNAIVQQDGTVGWIDWEHCGIRNRLDDMAWMLCDEYVPYSPGAESRLFGRYASAFGTGVDPEIADDYLAVFGTLHMCVRLALIVVTKGSGPWWDAGHCADLDKVGVTVDMARGTCRRAAAWSARTSLTDKLSPWFLRVAENIDPVGTDQLGCFI